MAGAGRLGGRHENGPRREITKGRGRYYWFVRLRGRGCCSRIRKNAGKPTRILANPATPRFKLAGLLRRPTHQVAKDLGRVGQAERLLEDVRGAAGQEAFGRV